MARTSSLAACDQRFVEGCSTGRLLVGVCVAEKHGQHSGAQELVPAPSSISPRQVRPSVYDSGATYIGQALHVRLWQCDAGRSTLASRLAGQNGQAGKGMHLDRQQQFPAVLQQPCSSSHSNLHFQAARHGIAETPGGCVRAIAASRHCLRDPAQAFGFFFSSVGFFTTLASRRRGFGSETLTDGLDIRLGRRRCTHAPCLPTLLNKHRHGWLQPSSRLPRRREGVQSTRASPPQRPRLTLRRPSL